MGPKCASSAGGDKGKRKSSIIMEVKLEIIKKYESGMRIMAIANEYGRNQSTISTIIKNKEAIKASKSAKGVTTFSYNRTALNDEMETLLLIWIKDKEIAGDTITQAAICHKATAIFVDLAKAQRDEGGEGTSTQEAPTFKASHGWFERFKKRSGIHNVVRHGEAASADEKAAQEFIEAFKKLILDEGYIPQQVFNCDETGIFWKKMPRRTYITEEEKKLPGHKPMKDRLTLALCANASGDLKIKPLLVYHSENPRAFKAHNVSKDKLAVFWRSNAKAWVTRLLFVEWVNCCFGPAVKKYLEENGLPLKCILVLDNAPAHPPGLEEQIHPDFDFIKVLYLPPNTTSILQPMDQQVIANFKKLYTKHLFKRCFEVTESTQLTLREFWKSHYDIVHCLKIIEKAWGEVSRRTLKSAWRKLWAIPTEEEAVDDPAPLEDIISLSKSLGLVVDEADIDNLLDEHKEELNTDDLKALEAMQISDLQEEHHSSGEEEVALTSTEIRKAIGWFENLNSFIEKKHPEKMRTARAMDNVNDICMSHFRNILRSRQKQASLDRYFSKRSAPESEEASVSSKKTRKESEDDDVEDDVSPQI